MAALDGNYHGLKVGNHAVTTHGGIPVSWLISVTKNACSPTRDSE